MFVAGRYFGVKNIDAILVLQIHSLTATKIQYITAVWMLKGIEHDRVPLSANA